MSYRLMDTIRIAMLPCTIGSVLIGCAAEQPQSSQDRALVTGVTNSNGGGMPPANFSTFGPIRTQ